jgi:hypothetical protein
MSRSVKALEKLLALEPRPEDKVVQATFTEALTALGAEDDPLARAAEKMLRKYHDALDRRPGANPDVLPGLPYDLKMWIKRLRSRP